ncbi:hypothetical protein [Oscillibacter sp.]|uniref:hypothetical protein n=1 Tax=Oscillibacter sp. TaxID=1945593 RepID=UPI0028B209BF|nr:hypothetical protein [Oscillibacter sp.]
MATNYTRRSYTASNGINLQIIKTAASNIKLIDLGGNKNLKQSGYTGVNGGFFSWNSGNILSLAKCDGQVLCNSNNWLGAAAIYWNSKALNYINGERQLTASEIPGTLRSNTWAQGGYYMWLGANDAFNRAMNEVNQDDGGYLTQTANGRTALVADIIHQNVYLIVTNSNNTFTTFCRAIEEYLGITPGSVPSGQFHGVMLDGGGSSQLCEKGTFIASGDQRMLHEAIVLRNDT